MNEKNLRTIKLTHEEAVNYGRLGGIRSGFIRRQKRDIKRTTLLLQKMEKEQILEIAKELYLKNEATRKQE